MKSSMKLSMKGKRNNYSSGKQMQFCGKVLYYHCVTRNIYVYLTNTHTVACIENQAYKVNTNLNTFV